MMPFDTPDQGLRSIADPAIWQAAQPMLWAELADASFALGQLDAAILGLPPAMQDGMRRRLALLETEAILWADGHPLPPEDIAAELLDAHPAHDFGALRFARWAMRRLQGQGDPAGLRGFLALHRRQPADAPGQPDGLRPIGDDFDAAALAFAERLAAADLHPLLRGPLVRILWRLAGLSPPDRGGEVAIWIARDMARYCPAVGFVPLGAAQRRAVNDSGTPPDRMLRHLTQIRRAAQDSRQLTLRVLQWQQDATAATARIKGDNPARILAVLAAHPLLLTADVAEQADVSRITAERLLARMQEMGLIREVTGTRRYRLWAAGLARA